MPDKSQITAAIQQGIADVTATFGNLSDEQLATQIHAADGGWTARDILAHLAGREQVYAMMQQVASGGENPFTKVTNYNDFNEARVTDRQGKSRDELLSEVRTVHENLLAQVQAMSDEQLAGVVPIGQRTPTLGDLMYGSGGTHSSNHAKEVSQVLG